MPRVRANERIYLSTGAVMTLREALDQGLVRIRKSERWSKRLDRMTVHKVAFELLNPDVAWDVSDKMRCSDEGERT